MAMATASQLVGPAKLRYRTAQFEVGEVVAWLHVLPEYGCYQTVRGVIVRKSATRLCLQVQVRNRQGEAWTTERWVKPSSVQPWVEPEAEAVPSEYIPTANAAQACVCCERVTDPGNLVDGRCEGCRTVVTCPCVVCGAEMLAWASEARSYPTCNTCIRGGHLV